MFVLWPLPKCMVQNISHHRFSFFSQFQVWGIFDDSDAYNEVFGEYRKINPYIGEISYRKLPLETYKDDLLNALWETMYSQG